MSAKKLIPIADQQVRAQPVEQPGRKRRFTPPSANTILVALIVLTAIATWLVPGGVHDRDKVGAPKPGTYHEAEQNPHKARFRAQGEGGVQGLTAKHKTILAVFGLAFGVTPA